MICNFGYAGIRVYMRKMHKEREEKHGEIQRDLKVTAPFRVSSLLQARIWGRRGCEGRPEASGRQQLLGVHTWTALEEMRKWTGEEAGNLESFICCLMFLKRNS